MHHLSRRTLLTLSATAALGLLPNRQAFAASADAVWQALAAPGAIGLLRHALAPGTGDPANFVLGDCSTQRNLNATGRAQARAIGAAIRERDIAMDRVLSSQWCRCLDTAELLDLGPVEPLPALNSFFGNRSRGPAQTRQTLAFLHDLPREQRVMLVTHQVNITALTGQGVASGELFVAHRRDDGSLEVQGSVRVRP